MLIPKRVLLVHPAGGALKPVTWVLDVPLHIPCTSLNTQGLLLLMVKRRKRGVWAYFALVPGSLEALASRDPGRKHCENHIHGGRTGRDIR